MIKLATSELKNRLISKIKPCSAQQENSVKMLNQSSDHLTFFDLTYLLRCTFIWPTILVSVTMPINLNWACCHDCGWWGSISKKNKCYHFFYIFKTVYFRSNISRDTPHPEIYVHILVEHIWMYSRNKLSQFTPLSPTWFSKFLHLPSLLISGISACLFVRHTSS